MKKIIETVQNNICSGCGICVAVCPKQCLKMTFSDKGEFYPQIIPTEINKCVNCHLCSDSCNFLNQQSFFSDSKLKWNAETGYYLSSYVGYAIDKKKRQHSASGGITTALLSHLLKKKEIDYVITAKQTQSQHPLIHAVCCSSIEKLYQCSGSFYYPIDYSEILKLVLKQEGKYAIVGLPCMLSSLSLACKKNKKLNHRIKYKIGLTCGSNKSAAFTDYLAKKYVSVNSIQSIKFREKISNEPASNYKIKIETENSACILASKTWGKIWSLGVFDQYACSYCDDVFAEAADVVLMDAWLPTYIKEPQGTNLIICRNEELDKQLHALQNCKMEIIDINEVIYSQKKVASPIIDKQINNIYYSRKYPVSTKAMRFEETPISLLTKWHLSIKRKAQLLYLGQYKIDNSFNIESFDKQLRPLLKQQDMITSIQRIIRKIFKILKRY